MDGGSSIEEKTVESPVVIEMRCRQLMSVMDAALANALKELPIRAPHNSYSPMEVEHTTPLLDIHKIKSISLPYIPSWSGAAYWLGDAPRLLVGQRGHLQLFDIALKEEDHMELINEIPVSGGFGTMDALGGLSLALGYTSGRVDIIDPWGHRVYRTLLGSSIKSIVLGMEEHDPICIVGQQSGNLVGLVRGEIQWCIDTADYIHRCQQIHPNTYVKSRHNGIMAMTSVTLPPSDDSTPSINANCQWLVSSDVIPNMLAGLHAGRITCMIATPARVNTMATGYFDASFVATQPPYDQVVIGCEDGGIYLVDLTMLSRNEAQYSKIAQFAQPIRQVVAMPLTTQHSNSTMAIVCITTTNTLILIRDGKIHCKLETIDWIDYIGVPVRAHHWHRHDNETDEDTNNVLAITTANGDVGWYRVVALEST
ncbi:hypothetical protein BDF22DRAFT_739280 [Syncephalis plumigaleata]|nr:hypothetical protein BDF22DRAFT_739280 [Syncephalis plumigaleata]